MTDNNDFGAKITELRKMKKMKQKELAARLGISPSVLSDYEHNRIKPTMKTMFSMCDIFNVAMDYFYSPYNIRGPVKGIYSEPEQKQLIPVYSFDNTGEIMDRVGDEPAPEDISDAPDTYFYLKKDDELQLFQFFSYAEYIDAVFALDEKSSVPDIFNALEKDGNVYFIKDNVTYRQDELKILAVPFIPIIYRKHSKSLLYNK